MTFSVGIDNFSKSFSFFSYFVQDILVQCGLLVFLSIVSSMETFIQL